MGDWRPFTAEDDARLLHLREVERLSCLVIAERMDRHKDVVFKRYKRLRPDPATRVTPVEGRSTRRGSALHNLGDVAQRVTPSAQAVADAQARARLVPRTLTAAFFGDPLPGRSALDQRVRP